MKGKGYHVELPVGASGWMDEYSMGRFEETADVQFNTSICSNVRTLELLEGGEYPHWSPDGKNHRIFQANGSLRSILESERNLDCG